MGRAVSEQPPWEVNGGSHAGKALGNSYHIQVSGNMPWSSQVGMGTVRDISCVRAGDGPGDKSQEEVEDRTDPEKCP